MKETVVLYTGAGAGHLMPMVALSKQFIQRGFCVTIVTFDHFAKPGFAAGEAARISSSTPSISFHILSNDSSENDEKLVGPPRMQAILHGNNPKLLEFLSSLSKTESVRAVVLDFFCTVALDVTNQLSMPTYIFIAFGTSDLAVFLHLLHIHETSTLSLKDMGENTNPIPFPGVPPIPANDMPYMLLDRESEIYKGFIQMLSPLIKGDGFLINSFDSLEPKALVALREGLCLPGHKTPPIYCIGPLVNEGQGKEGEERHEALTWLDTQPKESVIFLCFGSMGAFTPDQIKKIAIGLENSGQRFLWVVKVTDGMNKIFEHKPDFDLHTVLPEGFLDRTKDRGMVVKSWAPQVEILQHESVGGFVTHCGWNSILETIIAGQPMICWPLYAEQSINKTILIEEIKIGVVMEGYDKEMVEAEEVEKKVRLLMESEERKTIKERVVAVKEKAQKALRENGSSSHAFLWFLEDLKGKNE
ncbi:hypothetical protein LUZ60_007166 [Juncus effusus]|nr:hypothetical protein LUZ60_007166 [Juncus effusus]